MELDYNEEARLRRRAEGLLSDKVLYADENLRMYVGCWVGKFSANTHFEYVCSFPFSL
jgi:hypothetical protein